VGRRKGDRLTDGALDEGVAALLDADECAVLPATLAPAAEGHLGLELGVLQLKVVELAEASLIDVELRVEDEDLPGDVAHANERVDEVGAEVRGHVLDPVLADTRTIYRPVAEVAHHPPPLRALTCNVKMLRSYLVRVYSCAPRS
jgi:hypothetical protein